jgi:hypothetical protein
MRDVKNTRLEIRLTPAEKEQFKAYAEKHDMTMSEAVLSICQRVFALEKEENQ